MNARPEQLSQVKSYRLRPGEACPRVVEPERARLDAVAWAAENLELIDSMLREHAAVLFRGFELRTPQAFEAFASAIEPELYGEYGDLPKKQGGEKTYQSTPYPKNQMILFHNESAHLARWPRKQWFYCEQPSPTGGATPIVDCREVLRRLPARLVAELETRQLLYVRTFIPRLDVSWREFFKTNDRPEVERKLQEAGTEWSWLDADGLQTRTRCPAIIRHPLTGEKAFFNQVQLHHPSCLDADLREDLLTIAGPEWLPRDVRFGDGAPIPDADMALIGEAYEACAIRFSWQQGDVLMLDNMLAAHARDPYDGPRKIVVAMGDMYTRSMLEGSAP